MFQKIEETGFLHAFKIIPNDLVGTEEGVVLAKEKLNLPVEFRLDDNPTGNGRFNRLIVTLLEEETTLNPWASTFVKETSQLVLMFQTDADAVYFKLLMHA